jgi:hypothetical protein
MSKNNPNIPILPVRPRVRTIAGRIHRSYHVGKQNFSRAFKGEVLKLTITIDMDAPFRGNIQARLITTLNSEDGQTWNILPFHWDDSRTLICEVMPLHTGFHSFRAEFLFDEENLWIRDSVPDSWILVDPPQVDGLCLYTLIPNVSGTIADWIADLERISDLGFNGVHVLPLTMLDTSESPYSAKDLFHIDPRYLVKDTHKNGQTQLEEFVHAAKEHNIKLCFDLVLNHVGVHSNIAKNAPDWIIPDPAQPDGMQRARYYTDTGLNYWSDLVLINYDHPSDAIKAEIWEYMTRYMLFWAHYANETGGFIRFDNLHSSNPAFIQSLSDTLHKVYPDVGILAEYFADETTLVNNGMQWGLNLNLATPWDYKFVPKLREYLKSLHRMARYLRYYMPVTSHDSGSPAQEFCSADATIPRYVAAALLGTGATGIVQGVEFGIEKKIEFIGKRPKLEYPAEAKYGEFIRSVNLVLSQYPAFRNGGNCKFVDNNHHAIIAAFRRETGSVTKGFLVICNFDILSSQVITIDLTNYLGTQKATKCEDILNGEKYAFPSPIVDFVLGACTAKVLKF